jgi:hypothetical protein
MIVVLAGFVINEHFGTLVLSLVGVAGLFFGLWCCTVITLMRGFLMAQATVQFGGRGRISSSSRFNFPLLFDMEDSKDRLSATHRVTTW